MVKNDSAENIRNVRNILLTQLKSDARYNRNVDERKVKEMAENFDENQLEPLTVFYYEPEDKYYIIDGQHRYLMLIIRKEMYAPCRIASVETHEEAAKLFYKISTEKRLMTFREEFKARLFSKESIATTLIEILQCHGFKYSVCNPDSNTVICMDTIESIYKKFGEQTLYDLIELLRKVWDGDRLSLGATFIKGLNCFMELYKNDFTREEFINRFKNIPAGKICTRAKMQAAAANKNNADLKSYARAFYVLYNESKKKNKLQYKFDD